MAHFRPPSTFDGEGRVVTARILIADDELPIVALFTRLLRSQGHECEPAHDAAEARLLLAHREFDLVLCDVNMPGESGLDLAAWLARAHPDTATVMVSGIEEREMWERALEIGTFGYLTKPVYPSALMISVANALRRRDLELSARGRERALEERVAERTKALHDAIVQLERSQERLSAMHEETVRRLAQAAEYRDDATGRHIERMSRYCALLADRLGIDPAVIENVRLASLLHDVGKIAIPDSVLLKPGPLDDREWQLMRAHPELGHDLLRDSESDLLSLAASIALTHHERLDGSGYPHGLEGESIPIEGRIAAVADALDAMTSERVYKRARPLDEAFDELESGRGSLFDPDVLDALEGSRYEVQEIFALTGAPA
jgi:putative two-component system response regulator